MGRKTAVIALALLATTLAGKASAECKPNLIGELPVTMAGARPLVHGKIDGQDVSFIIDTGASTSLLSAEAVAWLKLKSQPLDGVRMIGVGGEFEVRSVRLEDFILGGFRVKSSHFLVSPTNAWGGNVVGLFGQDFLTQFEMEFDLANGVIRVFKPEGCENFNLAYWTTSPAMAEILPYERASFHIKTTVLVNDVRIRAILDTGASASVLSLEAAARAGITPESPGVTPVNGMRGLGGVVEAWLAPVKSFAVGSEAVNNTRLRIGDLSSGAPQEKETGSRTRNLLPALPEMLIGADFFLAHRIFVSHAQRKLFFSYNGGGIFRPVPNAGLNVAAAPTPSPAATAEAANVDALTRRAAASVARRDYVSAMADLSRAIELEPQNARHRLARARVHAADGKGALARTDLDEAARLDPKDPEPLLLRARQSLGRGDEASAKADFELAIGLAPDDRGIIGSVASAYQAARRFETALHYMDRWMAKYPDAPERPSVLNNRCWLRATWGQQLDLALADCDAAIEARPRVGAYLDSRALVHLRAGRYAQAIADYDAALRADPQAPWSLYGRGIARKRAGRAAAGEADMKAGLALNPNLRATAEGYGLELP